MGLYIHSICCYCCCCCCYNLPTYIINSSQCFTLYFRKHGIILALQEWCMTWIKMNSPQILGRYRLHSITLQNVCAVAENHVIESDFNSDNFGVIS